ncbi:unnamed protein product [Paramecium pentaurelia]|uniref:Thioredoxin reductase n=1 Tax=Paramecium pentaurelia TaxID=43138 RepID=A0A8S1XKV2_9CILI|nr:unnamed protein product [Paramecium pentaurelia]
MQISQEFDFFVIGGGSGGLAAAKQAASYGAKVGLADFVKPSPQGTKWGLGGTCVNVGCIPKKLMHFAAMAGELRKDQIEAGWIDTDIQGKHDWNRMTENVQNHIKKLNFSYKNQLNKKEVKYYNKLAELEKSNIVKLIDKDGGIEFVKSKYILIAVGGRPSYPDNIPEIEKKVITSDDLFWLPNNPGKTLIVGASYVALECGGFLNGLGYDTTIMVRSILLRGFDQEIAGKIEDYMVENGIKFIKEAIPINIELTENNKRLVTWTQKGIQNSDIFDTVIIATGRKSDTNKLNLEQIGVKTNKNGKIICTIDDRTSIMNIYAIGDCVDGRPELTPTAIKCGQLLANRLFGGQKKMMCYQFVPTTIFTPLEYGCIGYSEEEAINKFTQNEIIIYHSIFKPLEWNLLESHYAQACMIKLIVLVSTRRVIGLHYLGPNAGEIVQGYAIAMKLGATKEQFDSTIGIHPTCSEEILTLTAIKGIDNPQKEGC